jgi:hypothetical protein
MSLKKNKGYGIFLEIIKEKKGVWYTPQSVRQKQFFLEFVWQKQGFWYTLGQREDLHTKQPIS